MPLFTYLKLACWDIGLTVLNAVLPALPVVKKEPGDSESLWPAYVPPESTDSRCSCPALNALANHGILPHSGKNIPFKQITKAVHESFHFAESFCFFVPWYAAQFLGRDYEKDTMNLSDLDVHNKIEHDASFFRDDAPASQSKPNIALIHMFLNSASGDPSKLPADKLAALEPPAQKEKYILPGDVSLFSSLRRAHCKAVNPQYTITASHRSFSSSNASTLLTFFHPSRTYLEPLLIEERLPEFWHPTQIVRNRYGVTIISFNILVGKVERGVKEGKKWDAYLKKEGKTTDGLLDELRDPEESGSQTAIDSKTRASD